MPWPGGLLTLSDPSAAPTRSASPLRPEPVLACAPPMPSSWTSTTSPAWPRDHDMKWLLELGAAFLTLRKLVLVNGSYEFAPGQAKGLGLMKPITRQSPGVAVDVDALKLAESAWERQVGPPRMPRTWCDMHGAIV
jgi:hypothetical protein